MILGVDTGGTFTDFVLIAGPAETGALQTHKVLSTPEAPERAILQGIKEMGLAGAVAKGEVNIVHGSTVATNAALEGTGVATAFITNHGFRDILTIGRQTRPALYQLESAPIQPPVPRTLCLEVPGRIGSNGEVIEPLDDTMLDALVATLNQQQPDAIAITLLFSFLNPDHERLVSRLMADRLDYSPFITCSCEVLPEYREYERGIATWLNATLGPLVRQYLLRLQAGTRPSPLAVMQSSGGTIDAGQAAEKSVNLLLSGPAGGLAAAQYLAELTRETRLMTFDMGGTSTDVALLNGKIGLTSEGRIGEYPVAVPMVDMHTIGAGGGSIASMDAGGLLQVGPRSAGADPGPACYGRGGTRATVTDANLVLGRLQAEAFLGGNMHLDMAAAEQVVSTLANSLGLGLEEAALGIIRVANEHMSRALRVISVARGHDPKTFRLCCFGGAGGLHICALAEAMGMHKAMVPMHAGVLSALGMILAPVERQLTRTHQVLMQDADTGRIKALFAELRDNGLEQLAAEGIKSANVATSTRVDLRYAGQSASLTLDWAGPGATEQAFHQAHEQRYGHRLTAAVELVSLRVSVRDNRPRPALAKLPQPTDIQAVLPDTTGYGTDQEVTRVKRSSLCSGDTLEGPALILETNATTWLASGWHATCDDWGNLFLEKQA